jgi:phosphopantothenoylcysteine decarboxylase/phosphopantothenate--cysteine ligase
MRILITAGPTREPIDAVRYIGNRSSGKMGAALVESAQRAGHSITLILGPVSTPFPDNITRINVETSQEMLDAVLCEFLRHDLLIMAAAVADYRPVERSPTKLVRGGRLTLELEATADIIAMAGKQKRSDQRTVGFSLEQDESDSNLDRARRKLLEKKLDLIVFNPLETINAPTIESAFLYPDGRSEKVSSRPKAELADILIQRSVDLFAK